MINVKYYFKLINADKRSPIWSICLHRTLGFSVIFGYKRNRFRLEEAKICVAIVTLIKHASTPELTRQAPMIGFLFVQDGSRKDD